MVKSYCGHVEPAGRSMIRSTALSKATIYRTGLQSPAAMVSGRLPVDVVHLVLDEIIDWKDEPLWHLHGMCGRCTWLAEVFHVSRAWYISGLTLLYRHIEISPHDETSLDLLLRTLRRRRDSLVQRPGCSMSDQSRTDWREPQRMSSVDSCGASTAFLRVGASVHGGPRVALNKDVKWRTALQRVCLGGYVPLVEPVFRCARWETGQQVLLYTICGNKEPIKAQQLVQSRRGKQRELCGFRQTRGHATRDHTPTGARLLSPFPNASKSTQLSTHHTIMPTSAHRLDTVVLLFERASSAQQVPASTTGGRRRNRHLPEHRAVRHSLAYTHSWH